MKMFLYRQQYQRKKPKKTSLIVVTLISKLKMYVLSQYAIIHVVYFSWVKD